MRAGRSSTSRPTSVCSIPSPSGSTAGSELAGPLAGAAQERRRRDARAPSRAWCSATCRTACSASTSCRCSAGDAPPRLLFVAPNLDSAARELDVDRDAFLSWIAPTSSRTCSSSRACPGCASTSAASLRDYLDDRRRADRRAARPGGLPSLPDLARLVERVPRGRPRGADPDARAARADATGPGGDGRDRGPRRARDGRARRAAAASSYAELRAAHGPPPRAAARRPSACSSSCSGLDIKMRQYEQGKPSATRVVGGWASRPEPRLGRARRRCPRSPSSTSRARWLARIAPSRRLRASAPSSCNPPRRAVYVRVFAV